MGGMGMETAEAQGGAANPAASAVPVPVSNGLFDHFLVVRLQESIPPNPVSALVSYHLSAPHCNGPFPPDTPNFVFPDRVVSATPGSSGSDSASPLRKVDEEEYAGEAFAFVLTDASGVRQYGFVRRFLPVGSSPRYPEALCLLTKHPYPNLMFELLEHVQIRWMLQPAAAFGMLEAALQAAMPKPGHYFYLTVGSSNNAASLAHPSAPSTSTALSSSSSTPTPSPSQQRPLEHFILPRVEDGSASSCWPLSPLARYLNLENTMLLLSALLCEQRIVFVSKHLPRLSESVQAAIGMLGPLEWTHMLVPLLPHHLLSYCCMPMPFVVGVHSGCLEDLLALPGLDELILVYLDAGNGGRIASSKLDIHEQVRRPEEGDELVEGLFHFPLPEGIASKLRKQLKELDWGTQQIASASSSSFPFVAASNASTSTSSAVAAPVASSSSTSSTALVDVSFAADRDPTRSTERDRSERAVPVTMDRSRPVLDNQALFEAFLTFYLQLFAHVDWQAPLRMDTRRSGLTATAASAEPKGKFDMDAFLVWTDRVAPHNHSFFSVVQQSQAVERFLQQGCEKHHVASGGGRGAVVRQASGNGGAAAGGMSLSDRFERLRLEVVSAAAANTPTAPLQDTFSFSFVLKKVHAHLDAVNAVTANQAAIAVAHLAGSSLPRFAGEVETRKLALELTSNSPFNPAAHKGRSARDLLSLLTLGSFDSRVFAPVLAVLCERVQDCKKRNFAHGHKALVMLLYLLQHGCDRTILAVWGGLGLGPSSAQASLCHSLPVVLQGLAYNYSHEHVRTQELVRGAALEVHSLVHNVFSLRKTRRYGRMEDVRKYAFHGATAAPGKGAASQRQQQSDALLFDPQFDEFRHRSLVEALLPALPPFAQLHARYHTEFDQMPTPTPPPAAAEEENEAWNTQAAAPASEAQLFDFSGLSGLDSAGFPVAKPPQPTPNSKAPLPIMPPSGFPAATAAVVAQPTQNQDWHAEFSGTTMLAPTAMALMPPSAASAPGRSAQSSPALPVARPVPAGTVSPAPAPAPAAPARVSAGPSNLVQAAIIDTSIFAIEAPAAPAAAAKEPPVSAAAAPVTSVPSTPAKVPVAAAAPAAAPTAAAPASSDPWAAFDDAFADATSPSQSVAASPVRTAVSSVIQSPTQSAATAPPASVAAAVPTPAPAAPAEVDPTAGLDLFFTTVRPAIAPPAAVVPVAAATATPTLGVLPGPPPLSEEEAAALRRRKEKAAAKRAIAAEAAQRAS